MIKKLQTTKVKKQVSETNLSTIFFKWDKTYKETKKESIICLFKKLLFTIENAAAAGSSQSNISRLYIWKDNKQLTANCSVSTYEIMAEFYWWQWQQ